MMAAEEHGGTWQDWYGRGWVWHIMADLYDALNQNTRATGQWEKSPPKIPPYPRPGAKGERKKKASVLELFKRFGGGKSGGSL